MSKPAQLQRKLIAVAVLMAATAHAATQDPNDAARENPTENTPAQTATATPQLEVPIRYNAPEPCPDRSVFLGEVRRRLSDSTTSADADSIAVSIERKNERFNGKLSFKDKSGDTSSRSLSGENCEEVASALALITALALQAKLPMEPEPSESDNAAPTPVAKPTEPEQPIPGTAVEPHRLRFELGGEIGAASGYSPNPSLTLGLFLGAVTRHALFRLKLGYATSSDQRRATGKSSFDLLAARADICALLDEHQALTAGLCGAFELGYLRAAGQDSGALAAAREGTLWAAPAALGRLRYAPGPSFRLELAAGALFPLYREQFIFRLANGSSDEIYEIPGVGWLASLGVAYVTQ